MTSELERAVIDAARRLASRPPHTHLGLDGRVCTCSVHPSWWQIDKLRSAVKALDTASEVSEGE
jgi:hypothetical protein